MNVVRNSVENQFKASVCIPTYNAGDTIEKCLESISNQTVKPYEILIVDGYSKDDTLKIVQRYPNVSVIGFAKGIGKARKMLAEHAVGDIVAWVDADVILPSNWLELHLRIHQENKEIMMLSGSSPDGRRGLRNAYRTVSPEESVPNISCEIKNVNEWSYLIQMACSMKKKVFSIINYDERLRVAEDWDFHISAYLTGVRSFYCEGLFAFHIQRRQRRRARIRYIMYFGNYVFFLKKYGKWYLKHVPKDFIAFVFSIAMVYALPLSFLSPFALLVYPAAWLAHSVMYKTLTHPFTILAEAIKGIGEHLYLLKIL